MTFSPQQNNVRKQRKVKNLSEDVFGTKHAKIHIDAQQIKSVQTRLVHVAFLSKSR